MEEEIRSLIIAALQTRKYDDIVEEHAQENLEMYSTDDTSSMIRNGDFQYELEDIFDDWVYDKSLVDSTDIPLHIRSGDYDEAVEDRFNDLYNNKITEAHLKQRENILDKMHQMIHSNSVLGYKYCGEHPCRDWDAVV